MNEIVMNSRGDQGVIRSMIIGFEVCEAQAATGKRGYDDREPAMLIVTLANDKRIIFEVATTDAELAPLVERFRTLFHATGDKRAVLKARLKSWLVRWHCVPKDLDEAVEDIYQGLLKGTDE